MTQIDVSPVDWDKPLEAVHEDGRVIPCALEGGISPNPDSVGDYYTDKKTDGWNGVWRPDGSSWGGHAKGWNIRNRQEPQSTDPKLVERALKLVRDLSGAGDVSAMTAEARRIIREIDGPKTDEEWAKQMTGEAGWLAYGHGEASVMSLVRRAIGKGKELEREAGS